MQWVFSAEKCKRTKCEISANLLTENVKRCIIFLIPTARSEFGFTEVSMTKLSVKKPYTVLVGVVLIIVLGIVSFLGLNTDLLPTMDLPWLFTPFIPVQARKRWNNRLQNRWKAQFPQHRGLKI